MFAHSKWGIKLIISASFYIKSIICPPVLGAINTKSQFHDLFYTLCMHLVLIPFNMFMPFRDFYELPPPKLWMDYSQINIPILPISFLTLASKSGSFFLQCQWKHTLFLERNLSEACLNCHFCWKENWGRV